MRKAKILQTVKAFFDMVAEVGVEGGPMIDEAFTTYLASIDQELSDEMLENIATYVQQYGPGITLAFGHALKDPRIVKAFHVFMTQFVGAYITFYHDVEEPVIKLIDECIPEEN